MNRRTLLHAFGGRSLFLLLLALASLAVAWHFAEDAFPIARVDFKVSRTNADEVLRRKAEPITGSLEGYKSVVQFGSEEDTSHYLELELGLPEMERLIASGLDVYYWYGRWFRPEQEEEYQAWISPGGDLVGYRHTVPEILALPTAGEAAARAIAEDFLRKHTGHPFDQLEFLSASFEMKPHRTDSEFEWKVPALRAGEADYHVRVMVQGDTVGEYGEYLNVPEGWERGFAKRRSLNEFLQSLATYAAAPLGLSLLALLIYYLTQHRLAWREAVPRRWLCAVALMSICSAIHGWPEEVSGYSTTQNWGSFVFETISATALATVAMMTVFWLLTLVADVIHREMLPHRLPFRLALGHGALSRPETVRALGIGIVFGCFAWGYVTLFYVIGRHFGVWSPVEIDYAETLSGWLPWAAGFEAGLSAAWMEEMVFRVCAILLYWKLFRVKWLAVFLSAVTWGFLHSSYPQMPGFTRGIELTLAGLLWSWLFLRYGIVATLTAHYLLNCWLTCAVVVQTGNWWNILGAAVVSLWPVAAWARGRWLLRRTDLRLAKLEATPSAPPRPEMSEPYRTGGPGLWDFSIRAISARKSAALFLAGAAMITLSWVLPRGSKAWQNFGHLELNRAQVINRADAILRERGFDPAQYRRVVNPATTPFSSDYLLEYGTLDKLAEIYAQEWPDVKWNVRYFNPGEKEEFLLELTKNGILADWTREIEREALGASLKKEAAEAIAIGHLQELRGFDPDRATLVSTDVTERQQRRDYTFIFERQGWDWGDSRLRTAVTVAGDEAISSSHYLKIPDEWYRDRAKAAWRRTLISQAKVWTGVGAVTLGVVLLVLLARRDLLRWKMAFLFALFPAALALINKLNDFPSFWDTYDTAKPATHFIVTRLVGSALGLAGTFLIETFRIALILGMLRWAFGGPRPTGGGRPLSRTDGQPPSPAGW